MTLMTQKLNTGLSEKPFPEFSAETLNGFYALGQALYQQGRYKEASAYFQFLTLLDIGNFKYWFGLGAAQQLSKDYDKAIDSYQLASRLDQTNPYVYKHLAECYLALNEVETALRTLDMAKGVAQNRGQNTSLIADIILMQSAWSKKND